MPQTEISSANVKTKNKCYEKKKSLFQVYRPEILSNSTNYEDYMFILVSRSQSIECEYVRPECEVGYRFEKSIPSGGV